MAPRKPSTPAAARARGTPAGRAAHVVGDAAAADAGSGPGSGNTPSGDWLAEISHPAAPAPGVAVSTRSPGPAPRGRATESKRGQRS